MSESTSVRLSQHTRDAVNKLAAEQGLTADRAIAVAVACFAKRNGDDKRSGR
jgi:predicted transcriptional regulator